ncbi:MAG: UPF0176 protein [Crocinitomicaceae bacterium]|jgi:UPF0176 protein
MQRIGKKQIPYGLSKEEAILKLKSETFNRITVSLYKYIVINNTREMHERLFSTWERLDCLGRIYIASEGINAQMSVPEHNWDQFKSELYTISEFNNVPLKIGVHHNTSFHRLSVRIRKKIVADGLTLGNYDIENVGNHLTAGEFNKAMKDNNSIVVDMRNHYESEIGYFDGAITPQIDTFREGLPVVAAELSGSENKKILLYCTGGIRCEKASAYLKDKGFKDTNQLHGGIIDYKHQVEREGLENRFLGSNYVFDKRDPEKIGDIIISHCNQCKNKCDRHVNCVNYACNLLFLQCMHCKQKMEMTCSTSCKEVINMPPEKLEIYYKIKGNSKKRFSKSLGARKIFTKKSLLQKIKKIFSSKIIFIIKKSITYFK